MNIFVSHFDPFQAALYLDDKRGRKMIVESAQMLSTVLQMRYGAFLPYKKTHPHHPSTLWAGDSRQNFLWLIDHATALVEIHNSYSNKWHKSLRIIKLAYAYRNLLPDNGLTPFANATDFKMINIVHTAYCMHLIKKWENDKLNPKVHLRPTWKNRGIPNWYTPESVEMMLEYSKD